VRSRCPVHFGATLWDHFGRVMAHGYMISVPAWLVLLLIAATSHRPPAAWAVIASYLLVAGTVVSLIEGPAALIFIGIIYGLPMALLHCVVIRAPWREDDEVRQGAP